MKLSYDVIYPPGDKQVNLPPIVMLHGMIDYRKTWKLIAPALSQNTGRIVYVVDERNHGSSPRSDKMDWVVLADDIGDFLRQQDIPKAVLVGHSMGGRAALTFALKQPEMVDKLIVEDIGVRTIRQKDGGIILNIIALLKQSLSVIHDGADEQTAKKLIVEFMKGFIPESEKFPNFDLDFIALRKVGDRYDWSANLDALEEFLTSEKLCHDATKLGVYKGDTMFLYGTKSFFRVNKDLWIEKLFPQSVKIPFEGGTHLLHHEFPKKFARIVSDFINKGLIPASKI